MSKSSELFESCCQALVDYLRSHKLGQLQYPPEFTANVTRGLRQQAGFFKEEDGVLYHKQVDSTSNTINLQRVIVSKEEKLRVIQACHDSIDGCHVGRDKSSARKYFIRNVRVSLNLFHSFRMLIMALFHPFLLTCSWNCFCLTMTLFKLEQWEIRCTLSNVDLLMWWTSVIEFMQD
ncbi:uncharacterized protein LOC134192458 isoform X1 [Corticium candelabrum]|uniref:uncharacterized protein LOC134192458 isoform X1 n=1 Tax=Corticium candelabrum TaxID=121492 RepID=UPI002E265BE5|nr:uncharacterized protein LOC134192458 isoform X1 [Corticium candelabrum]